MAEKIRDAEFRHPELAAFLQGLTDEQAATPGPLSVERGGVASQYWREDGRVQCREFKAATGGWTVTAGSGRRSGRASDRSGSNGAVSAAASAATAVSLWTRRWIWKARTSRPARKAFMRTPPVPTVAGRRAAS